MDRCTLALTLMMRSAFWACLDPCLHPRSSVRLSASSTMWGTPASLPLHTDWAHEHVVDALTPLKVNAYEGSLTPSAGQV